MVSNRSKKNLALPPRVLRAGDCKRTGPQPPGKRWKGKEKMKQQQPFPESEEGIDPRDPFEGIVREIARAFVEQTVPLCEDPLSPATLRAFLDHTLPPDQHEQVRQHWQTCGCCLRQFARVGRAWGRQKDNINASQE